MAKVISIKPATVRDIKAILRVRRQTWLATYPDGKLGITKGLLAKMDFFGQGRFERIKQGLADKNQKILAAKSGGRVIGFLMAKRRHGKANYLGSLYILPKYQSKGLGTKFMIEALAWLGKAKPTILHVARYNRKAIKFYKKFGFKATHPTSDVPMLPDGRKIPSIEMEKPN